MNDEIQLLRARVEGSYAKGAVVVVAGATIHDVTHITAYKLAASMAAAGHRALLVDANDDRDTAIVKSRPPNMRRIATEELSAVTRRLADGVSVLNLTGEAVASASSCDRIRELLTRLRSEYDFTVVDVSRLARSSTALNLAEAADGIIVNVMLGRAPQAADGELRRTLDEVKAPVLGVVTLTEDVIADFEYPAAEGPVLHVVDTGHEDASREEAPRAVAGLRR
jgi:Mrp family chromosome partitioning ATPase